MQIKSLILLFFLSTGLVAPSVFSAEVGLVGYWKLQGDCNDHSGVGNHGVNHHVDLDSGDFGGRDSFIEIANSPKLNFGTGDFSVSAWVYTHKELTDVVGDIVTKFDPAWRKGFNFTVNASDPGYNGPSDVRNLFFGVDNATEGVWTDCGRPNPETHNSDALTVFEGELYAGTTDAPDEAGWAHVYKYKGGQEWEDLGRLGSKKTRGVYAMVVHDGALYAGTSSSHGPQPASMDFGNVYRYLGGQKWEDIGQPGPYFRLEGMASYNGKLYTASWNIGGTEPSRIYEYVGGKEWRVCGEFDGPPCTLTVHNGRLYVAYPKGRVYAYDGSTWEDLGNPFGTRRICSQIHTMGVHRGELYAGSWPIAKVAVLRDGKWVDTGWLGDALEVVALATYNGAFYAGSIPRAEVFRFDGPQRWVSMRRLFDPPGFVPVMPGLGRKGVKDWTRASSFAVYQGKLFSSTATCYRTKMDEPRPVEIRGKVYSFSVGSSVSLDRDMGPGWKHVAAVRNKKAMELFVDGKLVASSKIAGDLLDVSSEAPLRIGFGSHSHFYGKIREVKIFNRGLGEEEIQALASKGDFSEATTP